MNKKVLIAMDSFKGTFSSFDINNLVRKELINQNSKEEKLVIECINIADGGEGSVEALLDAINGKLIRKEVVGPYGDKIESYYGIGELNNRKVAIIEVASVVGFQYKKLENDPGKVTTYGIGELIKDALDQEVEDIYICLGGSISNDAGVGIVNALGVEFFDDKNQKMNPVGKTLSQIKTIKTENIDKRIFDVHLYCLCDVTNPFYGPKGAAFIFAHQKGASLEELPLLDEELKQYHQACVKNLKIDENQWQIPGAGAAGGICYSLVTFFNATILSGIETVLKLNNINKKIEEADLVITGEGKLDSQSYDGKVISQIKEECKKNHKKLIGIFGCAEINQDDYMQIIPIFDYEKVLAIPKEDFKNYLINNTPKELSNKIKQIKLD